MVDKELSKRLYKYNLIAGDFNTTLNFCRDTTGSQVWFEAIAVIEFRGTLRPDGGSEGHYICDVKEGTSNQRFRTPAWERSTQSSQMP